MKEVLRSATQIQYNVWRDRMSDGYPKAATISGSQVPVRRLGFKGLQQWKI